METGWKFGSVAGNATRSFGLDWTSPDNALSSNDSYASASVTTVGTGYLCVSEFALGLSAKSITTIDVRVEAKKAAGDSLSLYFGPTADVASPSESLKHTSSLTATSDTVYEGSFDGSSFTGNDVNAAAFGIYAYCTRTNNTNTAYIDAISINITYEPAGGSRVQFIGV